MCALCFVVATLCQLKMREKDFMRAIYETSWSAFIDPENLSYPTTASFGRRIAVNDASAFVMQKVQLAHTLLPFKLYKDPMPRMHPFAGALDQNQRWGYVHNAKVLREQQQESSTIDLNEDSRQLVCNTNSTNYPKRADHASLSRPGYEVVQKIQVVNEDSSQHRPRVLCAIYTYEGNHDQVKAIAETWGARCDGFMAASTVTDPVIGAVHLPHFGKEGSYESIWQKIRSMVAYMYMNYLQDYDWFHILGDDTYIVVENMRAFLEGFQNATKEGKPLLVGNPVKPFWKGDGFPPFPGGGPGYSLNRPALELLVTKGLATCMPNEDVAMEDVQIGKCFGGILQDDYQIVTLTKDSDGAPRYHHDDPNHLMRLSDSRSNHYKKFTSKQREWRQATFGEPADPLRAVSNSSAVFHLIKSPNYIRQLDVLLYPKTGRVAQYCHDVQMDVSTGD